MPLTHAAPSIPLKTLLFAYARSLLLQRPASFGFFHVFLGFRPRNQSGIGHNHPGTSLGPLNKLTYDLCIVPQLWQRGHWQIGLHKYIGHENCLNHHLFAMHVCWTKAEMALICPGA